MLASQRGEREHLLDGGQLAGEAGDHILHERLGLVLHDEADVGFDRAVVVVAVLARPGQRMRDGDAHRLHGGAAGNTGQRELHLDVYLVVQQLVGLRCAGRVVLQQR